MKTYLLSLFLILTWFLVGCSGQPVNIDAVSSHSLADFVLSDQSGETMGVVDDVIVDSDSGAITYAVVTLPTNPHGISMTSSRSADQVAIPWQILSLDPEHNSLIFQLDTTVLDDAPRLEAGEHVFTTQWDESILQYWQPFLGEK